MLSLKSVLLCALALRIVSAVEKICWNNIESEKSGTQKCIEVIGIRMHYKSSDYDSAEDGTISTVTIDNFPVIEPFEGSKPKLMPQLEILGNLNALKRFAENGDLTVCMTDETGPDPVPNTEMVLFTQDGLNMRPPYKVHYDEGAFRVDLTEHGSLLMENPKHKQEKIYLGLGIPTRDRNDFSNCKFIHKEAVIILKPPGGIPLWLAY